MPRAHNQLTTGRIAGTVYDLRHWRLTLVVLVVVGIPRLLGRFVSGRNLWGGGRSTDATFLRAAVSQRKGWWNDMPGWKRAGLRCCGVAGLWLWSVAPTLLYILLGCELVVTGLSASRRLREQLHEKRVLRPVWPAVAGIIGIPETEPPSRWLDIPASVLTDPTARDAEITVGLRAADAEDERRVAHLVTLFDQRFGCRHHGVVDYAARLVHIRARPAEPYCWPAVAALLGVDPAAELAEDWITIPDGTDPQNPSPDQPGSRIVVRLPQDAVNMTPFRDTLKTLVNQQYPGVWSARAEPASFGTEPHPARVVLTRQAPPRTPPGFVDFLAEHPDYQEVN